MSDWERGKCTRVHIDCSSMDSTSIAAPEDASEERLVEILIEPSAMFRQLAARKDGIAETSCYRPRCAASQARSGREARVR